MDESTRRKFIKATGAGGLFGLAGCAGGGGGGTTKTVIKTRIKEEKETVIKERERTVVKTKVVEKTPEQGQDYEKVEPIEYIGITRQFSPWRFEFQQIAAQMLERLGITIDMKITQWNKLVDLFLAHDYDMMTMWGPATPRQIDPYFSLYFLFHSKFIEEGNNIVEYSNPEYDEVAEKVKTVVDREERQAAVYEAQEILARDQPYLFGVHPNSLSAANTAQFTNWAEQTGSQVYWNVPALTRIKSTGQTDTVIFGTTKTPPTLNTMGMQGAAPLEATKMIYSKLARYDIDGQAKPWAAESFEWQDNTTLDATIRDGMTFHDGEPLTAEDVKFSMEYIMEWGIPFLKSAYDSIDSVSIPEDGVVRFNLKNPFSAFVPQGLAFGLNILPKHIWEGITESEGLEHPKNWSDPDFTGSGPFKFVEFEPQNRIVYETYDDYFMDIDFSRLIWKIYGSKTAAVGDLENNRATFMQQLQPQNFSRLQTKSNVRAKAKPAHGTTSVLLQNNREPLDDVTFRQSLAHALDKKRLIQIVLKGHAQPAVTNIAPAQKFWYNSDLPRYDGGISGAKRLLTEAGYRWDDQGNLLKPA